MERTLLKELIAAGLSSHQIANAIGKSQTTVRYWLGKYDLKTQPASRPDTYLCVDCGESRIDMMVSMGHGRRCRTRCKSCHSYRAVSRFRRNKIKAVEYKGGKCWQCGYNKCIEALEFHHRNPTNKDKDFIRCKSWSWERMKNELDKCELLCANCHRETHANSKLGS